MENTTPSYTSTDILNNIFQQLGKPVNLSPISSCLTRITQTQEKAYRVLIYCHEDNYIHRLTDTFWINVDENGQIIKSNPKIVKKYD